MAHIVLAGQTSTSLILKGNENQEFYTPLAQRYLGGLILRGNENQEFNNPPVAKILGSLILKGNKKEGFNTPFALRKLDYVGSKLLRSTSLILICNRKWEKYNGLDNYQKLVYAYAPVRGRSTTVLLKYNSRATTYYY